MVRRVEYFPIEGDGDRIEFTFYDTLTNPVVTKEDYPPRLVLTFDDAEVRLPANKKFEPFMAKIPGQGLNRMKAWNRNNGTGGSVFELYLKDNMVPKWRVKNRSHNTCGLMLSTIQSL